MRLYKRNEGLIAENGAPQRNEQTKEEFWRGGGLLDPFRLAAGWGGRAWLAGSYAFRAGDGDLCRAGSGLFDDKMGRQLEVAGVVRSQYAFDLMRW